MVRIEMKMPDLSTAHAVIKVMKWLAEPGQAVQRGQPLLEIESDKAVREVEASVTETLAEIRAGPETEVEVGQVIAIIATQTATAPDAPASPPGKQPLATGSSAGPGSSGNATCMRSSTTCASWFCHGSRCHTWPAICSD